MNDVYLALFSAAIGSALPWPLKAARRLLRGDVAAERRREESEIGRLTGRVSALEELIDLLRKALDKHLIRESAVVTLAELLITMMDQLLDHLADPPPSLLRTYERALELLKLARAQLEKINEGGN